MSQAHPTAHPWESVLELLAAEDAQGLAAFVHALPPEETTYTVARLSKADRAHALKLLSEADADLAADVLEHFSDEYAADILDDLEPRDAAVILDEMDSDEQADVLAQLEPAEADAILDRMDADEAADTRRRLAYEPETAGGLMITEFLAFRIDRPAAEVLDDLRKNGESYVEYEVRYLYAVDAKSRLVGVVPIRRLVMLTPGRTLADLVTPDPYAARIDTTVDDLEDIFDRVDYGAVPVVDGDRVLVGVVRRAAVHEALREREAEDLLKFGGIIGGQELRSMPWWNRTIRRLAFLLPNIVLSFLAVGIIAIYEPVIERLTALAVFIPMVANLSGAAGNQAVAVSIRELSLGLLKPNDIVRVWKKELLLGLFNGVVIGTILGAITWVTHPEAPVLVVAVGGAYAVNSVLSVGLGGALPLLLTKIGIDPAMMSSPILTTLTDMGAFSLTLTAAAMFLAETAPV